ncbi:MAG: aspartate carbamoyltransferase catalytic subunit [Alphaproteobacteria bacterium]|nr:MAG: aspartate carbamoyltransferase catalytic subunit [Alphaproteobacteria bacterium]
MSASSRHLLTTEHLSVDQVQSLFQRAEDLNGKYSPADLKKILLGQFVVNLFFNDSTRTRISFEIAAKRLGADVINVAIDRSSLNKGETFLDMLQNIQAMGASCFVIRHPETGILKELAPHLRIPVINAGDGNNEHPTQGLLDVMTMRRHKKNINGLTIAICGDIAHSRVARSNIPILLKMGAKVRVIAPQSMMPPNYFGGQVQSFTDLRAGIKDADIVMMLRIQKERMQTDEVPNEREYAFHYGLDMEKLKLAKPDVLVMHPGPMNRGVEIDSAVADNPKHSIILDQVSMGVAMRMAILEWILAGK